MKPFWVFVLFLITTTYPSFSFGWNKVKYNHLLAECLQNMIVKDNSTFFKNVRISIGSHSKQDSWKFGDIVDELLASNDLDVMFEIRNNNTEKSKGFTVHRRIMFVNSFEAFEKLVKLQRSHATNISGLFQYFYVILQTANRNVNKDIQKITQFCLKNLIANINILVEDQQGYVIIYSYYPFTPTSCNNNKPVVQNYYKNGTFTWVTPIFPKKHTNLWKCPLKVILFDLDPFVHNIEYPDRMFGVDVTVLNYLASSMNFTWQPIVPEYRRGRVFPNGTITDGFKMLYDRLGDIMLAGAFINSVRSSYFAATSVYFRTNVRLILKPLDNYSSLSILLFPFDQCTWLTILIVFVGKLMFFPVLWKKVSKLEITVRRDIASKFATIGWLLSILIITSSYEGSIYKFLHDNPRKKLPQNLDEAIADGYTFITTQEIYDFNVKDFLDIDKSRIKVFQVPTQEICRIFSKLNGKFALIATSASFIIASNEESAFKKIYQQWIVLGKPLVTAFNTMYMPKFSFLNSVLNSFIGKMSSNGIIKKIDRDFIESVLEKNRLVALQKFPSKLCMQNLIGAFELLGAMMGLAGCIFLIEMISVRNKTVQNVLSYFH